MIFAEGSQLTAIAGGIGTFENTRLTTLTLPESLVSIGNRTFLGVTTLESITIPASVTVVGTNVFSGWTNEQEIHIPFATLEAATDLSLGGLGYGLAVKQLGPYV